MSCISILSELIVVGGLIVFGFLLYGISHDANPQEPHPQPKK